jgi:hypothetical protein
VVQAPVEGDPPDDPVPPPAPPAIAPAIPPATPLVVPLLVFAAGVVTALAGSWQPGLVLAGAGVLIGALVRARLPDGRAGLLRVRHRGVDVVVLAALGIAMIVLALSLT